MIIYNLHLFCAHRPRYIFIIKAGNFYMMGIKNLLVIVCTLTIYGKEMEVVSELQS